MVDEINFELMWLSYIHFFYSDNKTMNENEYLSNQMRYIVLTVQTNSLKINKSGTKKDKYNLINELQNKYMIYKIIIK